MDKILLKAIVLCGIIRVNGQLDYHTLFVQPVYTEKICSDNDNIVSSFDPDIGFGYRVYIKQKLTLGTEVQVTLDSEGTILFGSSSVRKKYKANFTKDIDLINNVFTFKLLQDYDEFLITVQGKKYPYHPPYVMSVKINGKENCRDPRRLYFEKYFPGMIHYWSDAPDKFCGRQRIYKQPLELIVKGTASKAGTWPWHAAIYQSQNDVLDYICGGTLISKSAVLTAAHCATVRDTPVSPDSLGVILGKFALNETNEPTNQDKKVKQVIVHEDYRKRLLNNDIAILKLSTEAIYNNYVQPICIWIDGIYDKLDSYEVSGTIVGWGIDQSDKIALKLRETTMPIVPDLTCIRYEPIFYNNMLNGKKFCAGLSNGTAACNGDSGGGMVVYVEDDFTSSNRNYVPGIAGAWYLRGIVSVTLSRKDSNICDPEAYTILTDVAKYRDWILNNMN